MKATITLAVELSAIGDVVDFCSSFSRRIRAWITPDVGCRQWLHYRIAGIGKMQQCFRSPMYSRANELTGLVIGMKAVLSPSNATADSARDADAAVSTEPRQLARLAAFNSCHVTRSRFKHDDANA